MADTPRSVSVLKTLLATNRSNNLTAQKLRDFLVTALGVRGGLYCFEAVTQQVDPFTGAKLTCFTNTTNSSGVTPSASTDDLTLDVAGDYDFFFQCSFSGTASAQVKFRLRLDGVEQNFGCTRKLGTAGDIGSASFKAPSVTVTAGQVATIYVEMDGATDDLTVADAQFDARLVG